MEKLNINKIYTCKILKIFPRYVILQCEDKVGILHISEISDYKINDINLFFKVNENKKFILIGIENKNGKERYIFSYKRINSKLLKKKHEIIFDKNEFKTLQDNLNSWLSE